MNWSGLWLAGGGLSDPGGGGFLLITLERYFYFTIQSIFQQGVKFNSDLKLTKYCKRP